MNANVVEMPEFVYKSNPKKKCIDFFLLCFFPLGHFLRHQISNWLSAGVSFSWGGRTSSGTHINKIKLKVAETHYFL